MDSILLKIRGRRGVIAMVLAVIVILGLLFFLLRQKKPVPEEAISPELEEIKRQLSELSALRQQSEQQTPTEDEITQQLKELDILNKTDQRKLPTEEEIQRQLRELDALRAKSSP